MKKQLVVFSVAIVVFLLVLAVGLSQAQGMASERAWPALVPQAQVGTAFTYQGQLLRSGGPITATCDMAFRLYDAAIGGVQAGSPITTTVPVTAGVFTVGLDFGSGPFAGEARWLGIAVKCPGDASYTSFSQRQALTPVPYALYAPSAGNAVQLNGQPASAFWATSGNGGTNPASDLLGTTDDVGFTLVVSGTTALRLQPTAGTPNLVGGYSGNSVTGGVMGATIGGGGSSSRTNRVTDNYGTISGGDNNRVGNASGAVTDTVYATIGGGCDNLASGGASTVSGGRDNIASGNYAAVGGGQHNGAGGNLATVGGGQHNSANLGFATVGGGFTNAAQGQGSTVGGGENNAAGSNFSTISGGHWNAASGSHATVGGGQGNATSSSYATVGGGYGNASGSDYATVPGGALAAASLYGQMAYAGGAFASAGDAQTSVYVLRRTTTDATPTALYLDGSVRHLTVAVSRTLAFDVLVVARSDAGDSAGYQVQGVIENDGGATSFIGTPVVTALGEDVGAWDVSVVADNGNDALVIQVTGAASTTIRWVATVRTVEVAWW